MVLTVDLVCWSLRQPGPRLAALAALLSPDEWARAAAFRFAQHRADWIAARGGLRRVLAARTGMPPGDLRFHYGPHGRPCLGGNLRFSLSHAGGLAALALCDGTDPGLDIEALVPVSIAMARHHFADEECAALDALPPRDWQAGFFRCWTRKEAVVKATGRGLSMPLTDFAVTLSEDAPRLLRIAGDDHGAWVLRHLPVGAGFVGALALRSAGQELRLRFCKDWPGPGHGVSPPGPEHSPGSGWDQGPDGCRSHG